MCREEIKPPAPPEKRVKAGDGAYWKLGTGCVRRDAGLRSVHPALLYGSMVGPLQHSTMPITSHSRAPALPPREKAPSTFRSMNSPSLETFESSLDMVLGE